MKRDGETPLRYLAPKLAKQWSSLLNGDDGINVCMAVMEKSSSALNTGGFAGHVFMPKAHHSHQPPSA